MTKKEELLKSADFYPCQFESRSRSHSHSLGLHVLVSDKSACALIEIALSSFVSHTRDSPHISRMTNLGCKRTRTASHKPQSQIHHFTNYIEWNHNIPTTDVVIMRFHIFFFFSTQNLLFQFECVHDAERWSTLVSFLKYIHVSTPFFLRMGHFQLICIWQMDRLPSCSMLQFYRIIDRTSSFCDYDMWTSMNREWFALTHSAQTQSYVSISASYHDEICMHS